MYAYIATVAMDCPERTDYLAGHAVSQVGLEISSQLLRTRGQSWIRKAHADVRIHIEQESQDEDAGDEQLVLLFGLGNQADGHCAEDEGADDQGAHEDDNFFRSGLQ